MIASGNVEARGVISETGRVIEAKALSGHVALRSFILTSRIVHVLTDVEWLPL
jgi:hypothetical protein